MPYIPLWEPLNWGQGGGVAHKRPTRNFLVNLELTLVSGIFPSPQDGFFILYFELVTLFFFFLFLFLMIPTQNSCKSFSLGTVLGARHSQNEGPLGSTSSKCLLWEWPTWQSVSINNVYCWTNTGKHYVLILNPLKSF